jgi:16S rRNA (guanine966-N2)-methyltransferase
MAGGKRPKQGGRGKPKARDGAAGDGPQETTMRVVGGSMRGRLIHYSGDQVTRPMKDRTREALFNLLGPSVIGATVIDWFAGTGALAIESLSRGAAAAIMVERHIPTFRMIERTLADLKISDKCKMVRGDTFMSAAKQLDAERRTIHFFSPPYDLFVDRQEAMINLIQLCAETSAEGSELVVESDDRFDVESYFDFPVSWRSRRYAPAVVSIGRLINAADVEDADVEDADVEDADVEDADDKVVDNTASIDVEGA